ncbi:MAG: SsrA-binding protein SmpB [Saccharofermentanales bacterium]|nr:SsrA-binding protein SmpB [Eubacteriales bacterium]MDD3610752.1 SsrA-binding protein SmpB [Eubacteriales bacterium]HHU04600.1 SsrA-binding protein SmpB [Fastidiosipila sp.]
MKNKQNKLITNNRRARYEYDILETLETGIALKGTEVKSIRQGSLSLSESYVVVRNGELFLVGAHIAPYEQAHQFNHDPVRDRKLLAHKSQIRKLEAAVQQKGMTLVPTKAYFVRGKVKLEIAIARGKKLYDKRQTIRDREVARDVEKRMKQDY